MPSVTGRLHRGSTDAAEAWRSTVPPSPPASTASRMQQASLGGIFRKRKPEEASRAAADRGSTAILAPRSRSDKQSENAAESPGSSTPGSPRRNGTTARGTAGRSAASVGSAADSPRALSVASTTSESDQTQVDLLPGKECRTDRKWPRRTAVLLRC